MYSHLQTTGMTDEGVALANKFQEGEKKADLSPAPPSGAPTTSPTRKAALSPSKIPSLSPKPSHGAESEQFSSPEESLVSFTELRANANAASGVGALLKPQPNATIDGGTEVASKAAPHGMDVSVGTGSTGDSTKEDSFSFGDEPGTIRGYLEGPTSPTAGFDLMEYMSGLQFKSFATGEDTNATVHRMEEKMDDLGGYARRTNLTLDQLRSESEERGKQLLAEIEALKIAGDADKVRQLEENLTKVRAHAAALEEECHRLRQREKQWQRAKAHSRTVSDAEAKVAGRPLKSSEDHEAKHYVRHSDKARAEGRKCGKKRSSTLFFK